MGIWIYFNPREHWNILKNVTGFTISSVRILRDVFRKKDRIDIENLELTQIKGVRNTLDSLIEIYSSDERRQDFHGREEKLYKSGYSPGGHINIAYYGRFSRETQEEIKDIYDNICFLLYSDKEIKTLEKSSRY